MGGNNPSAQLNEIGQAIIRPFRTSGADLGIVHSSATNRRGSSSAWHNFSNLLRQALSNQLAPGVQNGLAADSVREKFDRGSQQAAKVSEANGTISQAHYSAHSAASGLNSRLVEIGLEGQEAIKKIIENPAIPAELTEPLALAAFMDYQMQASNAAGPCAQSIIGEMQRVFDQRGIKQTAGQFLRTLGVDPSMMLHHSPGWWPATLTPHATADRHRPRPR